MSSLCTVAFCNTHGCAACYDEFKMAHITSIHNSLLSPRGVFCETARPQRCISPCLSVAVIFNVTYKTTKLCHKCNEGVSSDSESPNSWVSLDKVSFVILQRHLSYCNPAQCWRSLITFMMQSEVCALPWRCQRQCGLMAMNCWIMFTKHWKLHDLIPSFTLEDEWTQSVQVWHHPSKRHYRSQDGWVCGFHSRISRLPFGHQHVQLHEHYGPADDGIERELRMVQQI